MAHVFKWFREHALWDAAKECASWLWAAGGSFVTVAAQAIYGFFTKHQDLAALMLTAGMGVMFLLVALFLYRKKGITAPPTLKSPRISPAPTLPVRSELEQNIFGALHSEFMCSSWAQKVALKLVCIRIITHEITLSMDLEKLGFGPAKDMLYHVVNRLRGCSLVEFKPDGTLIIHPARTRDVEELVNGWNFDLEA
ncbi:MAG: hypothetical protein ABSC05_29655 [Candidatus Solibacter sp.]|jgi:hypothetical protein